MSNEAILTSEEHAVVEPRVSKRLPSDDMRCHGVVNCPQWNVTYRCRLPRMTGSPKYCSHHSPTYQRRKQEQVKRGNLRANGYLKGGPTENRFKSQVEEWRKYQKASMSFWSQFPGYGNE